MRHGTIRGKYLSEVTSGFVVALTLNRGIQEGFFSPSPQAEMGAWIRSILGSVPSVPGDSPGGPRALSRAMTMPPISPSSAEGGGVTMRSKDGKDKDREKRFSFFGKKK